MAVVMAFGTAMVAKAGIAVAMVVPKAIATTFVTAITMAGAKDVCKQIVEIVRGDGTRRSPRLAARQVAVTSKPWS